MTDDFDDDALRNAIGSRSGGPVHTSTARHAVVARAERARTVRNGAIVGTTGLVVITGLFLLPNLGDTQPRPADQPAAPTIGTIAAPPTTPYPTTDSATTTLGATRPTTTTTTAPPLASSPAVPATTAPSTPSTTTAPQHTPTPTTQPATAPATSPSTTTTAPSEAPTTTTTSAAPDPSDPPFTRQYDSTGGSITVNWNGTALALVSTDPATDYVTEIEDRSADRIRVRFRSDSNDSRIEVRARDGHVEHTIS